MACVTLKLHIFIDSLVERGCPPPEGMTRGVYRRANLSSPPPRAELRFCLCICPRQVILNKRYPARVGDTLLVPVALIIGQFAKGRKKFFIFLFFFGKNR